MRAPATRMGHGRSLAAACAVALAGPSAAERFAGRPAALGRRRWRALPRAAVVLAAYESGARAQVGGVTKDMFHDHDADGDGMLTMEEYTDFGGDVDGKTWVRRATVFTQADINDDGVLQLAEYQFAKFLANEDNTEAKYKLLDQWMPAGFRRGVDNLFLQLRQTYGGKVWLRDVTEVIEVYLGYPAGLEEDNAHRLRLLYDWSDVNRDGTLNLNELDMFHFIVRDVMLEAAMVMTLVAETHDQDLMGLPYVLQVVEVINAWVRRIADKKDSENFTQDELLEAVPLVLSDHDAEDPYFRARVKESFARFDEDGDGNLDSQEGRMFLADILGWRAV